MDDPERKHSALTPALGLLFALLLGALGWITAPDVIHWLTANLVNFAGTALPLSVTRPVFTVLVVVLGLIVFGLVAALAAPKDARTVNPARLEHERDALRRRQKAERDEARKGKGREK